MMRLTFRNQMERRKGSKSFNKEADKNLFAFTSLDIFTAKFIQLYMPVFMCNLVQI